MWGEEWEGKSILCSCDNEAVVDIINTGTSKDPTAMGLMRCLYFITAKFNLLISAIHVAGKANGLADALSRNNVPLFLSSFPQDDQQETLIPEALIKLLVDSKPDWTSQSWSSMFNSIFRHRCQRTQCVHTPQAFVDTPTSAPSTDTSHSPLQNQHSASSSASLGNGNSSIN